MISMPLIQKQHLTIARTLSKALDAQFKILGISFGFDSVLSIVPGIGTIVPTAISLYLVWIGYAYGIPTGKLIRMIMHVGIDAFIGSIPLVGAFVDAFYKANIKNLRILEQEFSS
jgi:hypothetical protein